MGKLTAEEMLKVLISEILDKLVEMMEEAADNDDYMEGAKAALVECLEILQDWEDAADNGLDFKIEDVFPVK